MTNFYLINKSTWQDFTSKAKRLLGITSSITTNNLLSRMNEKTIYETQLEQYIDGTLSGIINYNGSEAIRGYAFYDFAHLESFSAPNTTSIGQSAFQGCIALKNFYAPRASSMSSSFDEIMPMEECTLGLEIELGSKNTSTQLSFCENSNIKMISFPNATKLNEKAFYSCNSLISAHFSKAASIGPYAFENCVNLQTITAPSATTIGASAFKGCTPILQEISFPEVIELKNDVFHNCKELQKVILPKCSTLGVNAFLNCSNLKEIKLGVTNTGTTFSKFSNLEKIEMSNATVINQNAFLSCSNLIEASIPNANIVQSTAFANCSKLTKAIYPLASVVQTQGFYNCESLVEADLKNVTSVGQQAFENCVSLERINLSKCTTINMSAFKNCSKLNWSGIFGLNSVSTIWQNAFENCTSLQFIDLPKCTTVYYQWPFSGCTNLQSLIFGIDAAHQSLFQNYNITYIDLPNCSIVNPQTFLGCASLSFVSLPKAQIIYQNAFEDCLSLENLILPICSFIYTNAFKNCTKLKTLTLLSDKVVTIQADTFTSCDALNKIYVPNDLYQSYQENSVWKNYINKLEKMGSICSNKFEIKDQLRARVCFTSNIEVRDTSLNHLSIGTNNDNTTYYIQGMYFPTPMYRDGTVMEYGPKAYYNIAGNNRFEGPKYIYDENSSKYIYFPDGCIMQLYYSNNDTDTNGTPVLDFSTDISQDLTQYYWWIKEINPPSEELEQELKQKIEELENALTEVEVTQSEYDKLLEKLENAADEDKAAVEAELTEKENELAEALNNKLKAEQQYQETLEKYKDAITT